MGKPRNKNPDEKHIKDFLEAVHKDGRGFIEIRALDPQTGRVVGRLFDRKRDEALAAIAQQARLGRNVFVGVARRRTSAN